MGGYPNIFNYATKELTQDAMICWFLECLKSGEGKIRRIGEEFLRAFVFENSIDCTNAKLIECSKQCAKMDVYARVLIDKYYVYPIIFENKTNTFLHGEQLERYCDKVYEWFWNNPEKALENQKKDISDNNCIDSSEIDLSEIQICKIQYVLFKSSYIFPWEETKFTKRTEKYCEKIDKVGFHLRTLEDMNHFLSRLQTDEFSIISDYKDYIDEKVKDEKSAENWDEWKNKKAGFEKALNSHLGQWKFFNACGAASILCKSDSGVYSVYSIVTKSEEDKSDCNFIDYCFRYGKRKGKKAIYLQQYRWEKGVTEQSEKEKRQKEYYELSLVLKNKKSLKTICDFDSKKDGTDGKEIFRVIFDDNNTPEKVAEFIKDFAKEFNAILDEVRKKL